MCGMTGVLSAVVFAAAAVCKAGYQMEGVVAGDVIGYEVPPPPSAYVNGIIVSGWEHCNPGLVQLLSCDQCGFS